LVINIINKTEAKEEKKREGTENILNTKIIKQIKTKHTGTMER